MVATIRFQYIVLDPSPLRVRLRFTFQRFNGIAFSETQTVLESDLYFFVIR